MQKWLWRAAAAVAVVIAVLAAFATPANAPEFIVPALRPWQPILTLAGAAILGAAAVAQAAFAYWTVRAVRIAEDQYELQQQTSRQQLRAYVGFLPSTIRTIKVGKPVEFIINYRNAGVTPAVESKVMIGAVYERPINDDVFNASDELTSIGMKDLLPGQDGRAICRSTWSLTQAQLDSYNADRSRFMLRMRLEYRDVFGDLYRTDAAYMTGHEHGLDTQLVRVPELRVFD